MKNFISALAISIYWGLLTLALAAIFSSVGYCIALALHNGFT